MFDGLTVFTSWPDFLGICLVLIIAEAVYVSFGFGAGLIAVGLSAAIHPEVRDIVVVLLVVNLPVELVVIGRARRHVAWKGVAAICLGLAAGVPLGTWILSVADASVILTLLGAFLIVAGLSFLCLPGTLRCAFPSWTAPPVGLAAGILGGLFGTGGPPVILYYQALGVSKAVFRGSLMAIFFLVAVIRLPCYAAGGLLTGPRLLSTAAVLPAVLLGALVGSRIHVTLAEVTFRRLVSVLLVAVGVVLLLRP